MKKLIVILALVAIACAPAMAVVKVAHEKVGSTVTVRYCTDGNSVRAFALDLSVSTGAISAVSCSSSQPLGYYVYPGSITIQSGSVSSYGSCVCSSTYPGTNPGIGSTGVTVEMGSLYTGTTKPASSGTLFTFTISNTTATVTVAQNTARGGVVMERAEEVPSVSIAAGAAPVCSQQTDCFPSTYTTYTDWKSAGKPNCWCGTITAGMSGTPVAWKYQCYGDADNTTSGTPFNYRIYNGDLSKVLSNWRKKITDPTWDRCTDFDHKSSGTPFFYRVYNGDLGRVLSNWRKKDTQLTPQCPITE